MSDKCNSKTSELTTKMSTNEMRDAFQARWDDYESSRATFTLIQDKFKAVKAAFDKHNERVNYSNL